MSTNLKFAVDQLAESLSQMISSKLENHLRSSITEIVSKVAQEVQVGAVDTAMSKRTSDGKKGNKRTKKSETAAKSAQQPEAAAAASGDSTNCLVPDCKNKQLCKQLCATHYQKSRRLKFSVPFSEADLKALAKDGRIAEAEATPDTKTNGVAATA